MIILNNNNDSNKLYKNSGRNIRISQPSKIPNYKYRADPKAQRDLNEIAAVGELQNRITYINDFICGTGRFSLQYQTEDEITREERWLKEERQRAQRQWLEQEERMRRMRT